MTPPEAPLPNDTVGEGPLAAGLLRVETLKSRADFLAAARARRVTTPAFILQYRPRKGGTSVRVGFTCSKKVGNAVARNRAKRRLREIARLVLPCQGTPGTDYVLIGRAGVTALHPFDQMLEDLRDALRRAS
ncbi:MAG: ribonuclease P protein component [Pseudomonadota bacterium]